MDGQNTGFLRHFRLAMAGSHDVRFALLDRGRCDPLSRPSIRQLVGGDSASNLRRASHDCWRILSPRTLAVLGTVGRISRSLAWSSASTAVAGLCRTGGPRQYPADRLVCPAARRQETLLDNPHAGSLLLAWGIGDGRDDPDGSAAYSRSGRLGPSPSGWLDIDPPWERMGSIALGTFYENIVATVLLSHLLTPLPTVWRKAMSQEQQERWAERQLKMFEQARRWIGADLQIWGWSCKMPPGLFALQARQALSDPSARQQLPSFEQVTGMAPLSCD